MMLARVEYMKRTPTTGKTKPASHAAPPEARRRKPAVPGEESSKVASTAKDVRSAHDKDGNDEQRGR
jgi:hypothetical protein